MIENLRRNRYRYRSLSFYGADSLARIDHQPESSYDTTD